MEGLIASLRQVCAAYLRFDLSLQAMKKQIRLPLLLSNGMALIDIPPYMDFIVQSKTINPLSIINNTSINSIASHASSVLLCETH